MLNKVDYIMFPARAMAKMIQKIGEDFGEDFLFNLGYKAGNDGADELIENFKFITKPVPLKLKIILELFNVLGFGVPDVKVYNVKKSQILFTIKKFPVAEHAKNLFKGKSKICKFYLGIFSAHINKELNIQNCHLIETKCITTGSPFCEWSYNYFKKPENKGKKSKK